VVLAAVAVFGGVGTAVADTPGSATGGNYIVTTWHDVNLRACSSTKSCGFVGRLSAADQRIAHCCAYGETISDFGITNDVWIAVNGEVSGDVFHLSAVHLEGDQSACLPRTARCAA
jgi:hypothetical protein